MPEWQESLENCLGLFALTQYLSDWVSNRWSVRCEVLRYPALVPDSTFTFEAYLNSKLRDVVMLGFGCGSTARSEG